MTTSTVLQIFSFDTTKEVKGWTGFVSITTGDSCEIIHLKRSPSEDNLMYRANEVVASLRKAFAATGADVRIEQRAEF